MRTPKNIPTLRRKIYIYNQVGPYKMQKPHAKLMAKGNTKLGNATGYLSAQNLAQLDRQLSERDRKKREQKRQMKH